VQNLFIISSDVLVPPAVEDGEGRVLEGVGDGAEDDEAGEDKEDVRNPLNRVDALAEDDAEHREVEDVRDQRRREGVLGPAEEAENLPTGQRLEADDAHIWPPSVTAESVRVISTNTSSSDVRDTSRSTIS